MSKAERNALLSSWIQPSSNSEKDRQERGERMVSAAITASNIPGTAKYRIYTKGSYRNSTNVRLDSDVDVVVELTECAYYKFVNCQPPFAPQSPYTGIWTPASWRSAVEEALVGYYGSASVDRRGKIALNLPEVPNSRPSADVVPAFTYYRYDSADEGIQHTGSCVFPKDSATYIVNWPQQQYDNGVAKNDNSGRRYKRFVRVLKNAENYLVKNHDMTAIPSYLMECLVYNVPNQHLTYGTDLDDGFGATLEYLAGRLRNDSDEMIEPNGLKWLFQDQTKWTTSECQDLVNATSKLFGYGTV